MGTIREKLKSIKFLRKFVIDVKSIYYKTCSKVAPLATTRKTYKRIFKRKLDLKNPRTLNEKMIYTKFNLYWENEIVAKCADKYRVREYVKEKECSDCLNPLLGCWDDAKKIDWDKLPDKFVIKCNHGSGYNILCTNKEELNIDEATTTLNKWIKEKYGYGASCEQGIYCKIKPLIIAEEYIETKDGLPPKDYKFFCSYGKCKFLFVASERVGDRTKFDYYWPDWSWIPVENCHPNAGKMSKPSNLDDMIVYAEKLSKDFPIVRVDLYEESGRIIFGELTFTHFGCVHGFKPDSYDYIFGDCFPNREELVL